MTARITISYERDQEKDQVLRMLRPLLSKAKIKSPKASEESRYKKLYIQLGNTAGEDP